MESAYSYVIRCMWPVMEEEQHLPDCVRHVMQKARGELWEKVGAVIAGHPRVTFSVRYEEEMVSWDKAGAELWVTAILDTPEALPEMKEVTVSGGIMTISIREQKYGGA